MGTKRERLLQKLNPNLLKMTPRLSGDAGSFVDLDGEDSLEEGARKLMMRFFRNQDMYEKNRRNSGHDRTEVTISSAKYNENDEICELITERLSLPFAKSDDDDMSEKPGRRLQKLKTELKEKMSAKWEEEYKKRIGEIKEFERKHKHRKKKSADSSSEKSDSEEEEEEKEEAEKEEEEEAEEEEAKEEEEEAEGDTKNLEEEYDVGDEADIESEDKGNETANREKEDDSREKTPEKLGDYEDDETLSLVPAYQPGGGLLYGGSELTQADEGLPQDLLSPSLRFSVTESPGCKVQSQNFSDSTPKKGELIQTENEKNSSVKKKNLFSQNLNSSFDLNDAFEFCSGKFPDASESQNNPEENPEPKCTAGDEEDYEDKSEFGEEDEEEEEDDEYDGEDEDEVEKEEVEEDSSPVNSSQTAPKNRKNIITFEDSDEEGETEKVREDELGDEESCTGPQNILSDDEDEAAVEETSKPKKKNRRTLHFSDEEDGENQSNEEEEEEEEDSAEEEEEERDDRSIQYDSEENEIVNPKEFFEKEAELSGSEWSGDEDERGLDELEEEEGDGENLDNNEVRSQLEKIHIRRVLDDDAREVRYIQEILFEDGDLHSDGKRRDRKFKWKNLGTFDGQGNDGEPKDTGGNTSDDDCAEEEEQRKLRYDKELFLMTKNKDGDESSEEEVMGDIQMVKVRRVTSCTKAPSSTDALKSITEMAKISYLSNTRGSFLTRDEEFLSRLAKATSSVTDNISGPKHCRNFVFASKSPEKSNGERSGGCKRQVEDSSGCGREEKRTKILRGEVDTGPSILDLLV